MYIQTMIQNQVQHQSLLRNIIERILILKRFAKDSQSNSNTNHALYYICVKQYTSNLVRKVIFNAIKEPIYFQWGSFQSIFNFMCMFCGSLFVLLSFFFRPLCCLSFFDLRVLIFSNSSNNYVIAKGEYVQDNTM